MHHSRYDAGGMAIINHSHASSGFASPSSRRQGGYQQPLETTFYAHPTMVYTLTTVHSVPGLHSEGVGAMSSGLPGKATAVDELKALILQAEAGTGEIARHIEEAQFTPRHNAFTSLLQLASKSRQPEKAIEIFEAMQTVAGISPNTFSYSALISALARVGNWEQAERYFKELKDRAKDNPDMKPNTVTYAAMISAYEKGRQLDKALDAFNEQLEMGVEADVITYASLLSACERAGAVDKAVELLDKMHQQGLAGPAQMYNSVIAACGARYKPALEVFLGMQCAGVEVTAQAATLLMASLCAGGQRDHAMALLSQVAQARWTLSLTAYSSLLQLLSSQGDWRAADMVHAHMAFAGIRPDAAAAGAIVNAHAIGGDQAGAEHLTSYFMGSGVMTVPQQRQVHTGRPPRSSNRHEQTPKCSSEEVPVSEGCLSLPISESLESEP